MDIAINNSDIVSLTSNVQYKELIVTCFLVGRKIKVISYKCCLGLNKTYKTVHAIIQ